MPTDLVAPGDLPRHILPDMHPSARREIRAAHPTRRGCAALPTNSFRLDEVRSRGADLGKMDYDRSFG